MSFQTPFTCELEYWNHVYLGLIRRWDYSYANQSQNEKHSVLFEWFYGFGKRKYLNNVWRNISMDSSDDVILILQNTQITTSNVPGCVAGANKSQTTYENICHSCWFNSASLYRVLFLGIYLYFSLLESTISIKQSHILKW